MASASMLETTSMSTPSTILASPTAWAEVVMLDGPTPT
jgi:hypothetical protein